MSPIIPIVLVTSSPLALARLARGLGDLPQIRLCGNASDLSGAYVLVERVEPRLVILGPELLHHPDFPGLLAMFRVMGITWMRLPSDIAAPPAMAGVPVLDPGQPAAALSQSITAALAHPTAQGILPSASAISSAGKALPTPGLPTIAPGSKSRTRPDRVILIGSSTGGIDALLRVLSVFPPDCPPTAIVQHTGAAFSDSLIRLLDRCCAARVLPAQSGGLLRPGTVIVGAGCGGHMRLQSGNPPQVQVVPGAPVAGHVPSVDEMFRSALPFASRVTAALLTGMGRDGAEGMLDLRRAGADTLAQDEATSVVYGMPRAAWEIGAARIRLPIDRIGPELLARCAERPPETTEL